MSVKVNGTDAKDIALHFLKATGVERTTPAIIAKTIAQAKSILKSGYTKEEVIDVIDHVVERGVRMYSIGYVSHAINDVLAEIEEKKLQEKAKDVIKEQKEQQLAQRKEVTSSGESTNRNKGKASKFGIQSRVGKKFDLDMFEE